MFIGIDPAYDGDTTAFYECRLEVGRFEGVRFITRRITDWRILDLRPLLSMPKWWRWFDVFRTWPQPKILPNGIKRLNQQRRVQERRCAIQRKRLKRRAFVQKLARAH